MDGWIDGLADLQMDRWMQVRIFVWINGCNDLVIDLDIMRYNKILSVLMTFILELIIMHVQYIF